MKKTELWDLLHDLFDTDDGSLPEIELTNLNSSQISKIYLFLVSLGKEIKPKGITFWDNELNQARSIDSVENPATLITEYRASPFHIVISSITLDEITIPDLGVFIFQESISMDYRKGTLWTPDKLYALLELLCQIKNLAPEVNISLQESESEEKCRRFQTVLNRLLLENPS
jgi:hypothetical protein